MSGMSGAAFDFDDHHTHHNAELALDEEKVACRARGREPRWGGKSSSLSLCRSLGTLTVDIGARTLQPHGPGGYPLYWGAGCLVGNRIAGDISDNRAVNAPDSPRRLGKAAVSTPQPFRNSSLTSIASRMYAPTDVLSLGLLH